MVPLWQSPPRLALAVIIGIIISRPVEIKIFETEIKKVIGSEIARNLEARGGQIEDAETRIGLWRRSRSRNASVRSQARSRGSETTSNQLSLSLSHLQVDLAYWRRPAEGERDGTAGSGRRGAGPALSREAAAHRRV